MNIPILLRIDLREDKSNLNECAELSSRCHLNLLDGIDPIAKKIKTLAPDVIFFEFDYPDFRSLKALEQTKKEFPSIPILMLTEHHNEKLAIWALRARVWDYFVKPVDCEQLYNTVCKLTELRSDRVHGDTRRNIVQPQQLISHKCDTNLYGTRKSTTPHVIKYVEDHYHEKIYISELAEKCSISRHQFSRVFKHEKGITFREYLVNYRLDKARELLDESQLSVGDVSFAVGFFDHSYFTRMFKRYAGLSPSDYRLRKQ